jgi:hypothetical protein
MDGHNVVELHGFYVMPVNTLQSPLRHGFRPAMQPYQPGRYGPPRRSYAFPSPIPPGHHTIYTPPTNYHTVAPATTVNRLRVFLLTTPIVYGTLYYDIAIPFTQATMWKTTKQSTVKEQKQCNQQTN